MQFLNGDPMTNNACESWYTRLSAIMPHRHPGFWRFLSRLEEEQEGTETRLAQIGDGEPPKKKRHSQQHREARLRVIVEGATNTGVFDLSYLSAAPKAFLL
jgi:hypothetical protein